MPTTDEIYKYINKAKDESFEELLKKAAYSINAANKNIKKLIIRRGRIQDDYRGATFVQNAQALILSLKELEQIMKEER